MADDSSWILAGLGGLGAAGLAVAGYMGGQIRSLWSSITGHKKEMEEDVEKLKISIVASDKAMANALYAISQQYVSKSEFEKVTDRLERNQTRNRNEIIQEIRRSRYFQKEK